MCTYYGKEQWEWDVIKDDKAWNVSSLGKTEYSWARKDRELCSSTPADPKPGRSPETLEHVRNYVPRAALRWSQELHHHKFPQAIPVICWVRHHRCELSIHSDSPPPGLSFSWWNNNVQNFLPTVTRKWKFCGCSRWLPRWNFGSALETERPSEKGGDRRIWGVGHTQGCLNTFDPPVWLKRKEAAWPGEWPMGGSPAHEPSEETSLVSLKPDNDAHILERFFLPAILDYDYELWTWGIQCLGYPAGRRSMLLGYQQGRHVCTHTHTHTHKNLMAFLNWSLARVRSHMPRGNEAPVPQLLSLRSLKPRNHNCWRPGP